MSELRYGSCRCPVCDRSVALRRDGTMRQHQAWLSRRGGTLKEWPPPCAGVGLTFGQAQTKADERDGRGWQTYEKIDLREIVASWQTQ